MIVCEAPIAVDGDTIKCGTERVKLRIRLLGIDAPELPGHCRIGRVCTPGDGFASKRLMASLVTRGVVQCQPAGFDRYGRTLARCSVGTVDLSCAMVAAGAAVYRYGRIACP